MVEIGFLTAVAGGFSMGVGGQLAAKVIEYAWETRLKKRVQQLDEMIFNVKTEQKKESDEINILKEEVEHLKTVINNGKGERVEKVESEEDQL
jgi:hypothetical protein